MSDCITVDSNAPSSHSAIRDYLYNNLNPIIEENRPIIFLCIGTDRATGDALGPLVGYKLKLLPTHKFFVYGTLDNPIHARNIEETLGKINKYFKNPFIVAIDACLGSSHNIGKVILENKPLTPGASLNKNLPAVGDISISGIVNLSGKYEFLVLQNTRLATVMSLADCIYMGISQFILKSNKFNKFNKFLN